MITPPLTTTRRQAPPDTTQPVEPPVESAATPQPSPEPEEDEDVIYIFDVDPPSTGLFNGNAWALWNLIISIAGVVMAIMMGIRILMKKRREKYDSKDGEALFEDDEKTKRNRFMLILAVPFLAVAGINLFILTQNIRLIMILIDLWTPVHIILFTGEVLCYVFAFKRKKDEADKNGRIIAKYPHKRRKHSV